MGPASSLDFQIETVHGKATVLIGVRREGKSTHLFRIIHRLPGNGLPRQNLLYLSCFEGDTGRTAAFPQVSGLAPDLRIGARQECFHTILLRYLVERRDGFLRAVLPIAARESVEETPRGRLGPQGGTRVCSLETNPTLPSVEIRHLWSCSPSKECVCVKGLNGQDNRGTWGPAGRPWFPDDGCSATDRLPTRSGRKAIGGNG